MLTLGHASIDRPDGLYGNVCFSLVELCVYGRKQLGSPQNGWVLCGFHLNSPQRIPLHKARANGCT